MVRDRAVPLSKSATQTALNAIGHERCMSESGRNARATLRLGAYACSASNGAVPRLPEVFYGMLAASTRIECQGVGDSASRPRVSLTVPCPKGMWICPKCHAPTTCAVRMQTMSLGLVRMPFGLGSSTFIVSAPASLSEPAAHQQRRHALVLPLDPTWRRRP